jgi:FtsH-binding integral membrane protein
MDMNFTDWLVNIALVALVLRQVRWSRMDRRFFLMPLALVGVAVSMYLKTIPTAGNDLVLVAVLASVGFTFGGLSALATSVRADGGRYAMARSRWLAVALWIVGIGSRMAFVLYSENGGESHIASFSQHHNITTGDAWIAALVIMALVEVVTRISVLALRSRRALAAQNASAIVRTAPVFSVAA